MTSSFRYTIFGILITLTFINIRLWQGIGEANAGLTANFFDVGQGDAIFIETPTGHQILIDSGPGANIVDSLQEHMPFGDTTIDLVIMTHPDGDHIGGMPEVFKVYDVEHVLWTEAAKETAISAAVRQLVQHEGAKVFVAYGGQKIYWDSDENNFLEILHPAEGDLIQNTDSNETSIVARLVFHDRSILFTGDISKEVEFDLLADKHVIDSDILKVAHHGSNSSSAASFLDQVSPEFAIIQAGQNNSYGHPHAETIENLGLYDITVLRTDKNGTITIELN